MPPPKEYFTPKQRAVARAVAFLTAVVLIVQLGDNMEPWRNRIAAGSTGWNFAEDEDGGNKGQPREISKQLSSC